MNFSNFLKKELSNMYKIKEELFPKLKEDISEEKIEIILQEILKKGDKWKNSDKIKWRNILKNQEENWKSIKKESLDFIKEWIEKQINLTTKRVDKEEIKKIICNLLQKNENKRVRTSKIIKELEKLKHNQYNDYNFVPARQIVYTCILELRSEYRDEEYKNGYIISGEILEQGKDKIDGWLFTKNKKLILNYYEKEIIKHNKAADNFSQLKEDLEKIIQSQLL